MPLGANKAAIMGVSGVSAAGDVVLILSQTASSDASISFTSGIDSTYGEYIFKFYVIGPETDNVQLSFQVDDDGGNNGYNDFLITSSVFEAYHKEDNSAATTAYVTGADLAQAADFQILFQGMGSAADEGHAGEFHLFNPSSTTYVKQFIAKTFTYSNSVMPVTKWVGGYINTTTAINAIQFKTSSGDFDGVIKMWGVK